MIEYLILVAMVLLIFVEVSLFYIMLRLRDACRDLALKVELMTGKMFGEMSNIREEHKKIVDKKKEESKKWYLKLLGKN